MISHWKIAGFGTDVKSEDSIRLKLSKILSTKVEGKRNNLKSYEHKKHLFDTEWIAKKQAEFNTPFDLAKSSPTPVKKTDSVLRLVSLNYILDFSAFFNTTYRT